MNAATTIVVSVLSGSAAAALFLGGSALLSDERPAADTGSVELAAAVRGLSERLGALEAGQAQLAADVGALSVAAPAGDGRRPIDDGELERRIEAYLAGRPAAVEATAPSAAAARGSVESLDLRSIIDVLSDEEVDWMEREEVWQELREAGRIDEVLAEFERLAAADPRNPDRQVELGYAYIQKIQEVGATALASKYATLADETFDRALALDETHWEARFMKAMALSHWPAFTGKTAESIHQFEKLIEIQETSPIEAKHAQAYLILGNLYLGQGKEDAALATWKKGLAAFPGHAELVLQVESIPK